MAIPKRCPKCGDDLHQTQDDNTWFCDSYPEFVEQFGQPGFCDFQYEPTDREMHTYMVQIGEEPAVWRRRRRTIPGAVQLTFLDLAKGRTPHGRPYNDNDRQQPRPKRRRANPDTRVRRCHAIRVLQAGELAEAPLD